MLSAGQEPRARIIAIKARRSWPLMGSKMHQLKFAVPALCLVAWACSAPEAEYQASTADIQLAREALLVDTHIDVPHRLSKDFQNVALATDSGDFDWPRAVAGGLDIVFMSIYIPADYQDDGGAKAHAESLIAMMESLVNDNPRKFAIAGTTDSATSAAASGKIAIALGMENGAGIEDRLENLSHFYARGIRYITLTHSRANLICDSSYDENRPWGGVSPFGVQVIRRMNELGIMVDVSHVSDAAFYQVLEITRAPVIASHSSARHFTPGWERNMSDDMIRALAANGGVIQVNFGSAFLTAEANMWSRAHAAERDALLEETGWDRDGPEIAAWSRRYRQASPYPYATLDDVLDHIDHVVKLVGVEHVGLGSDYDGVGDSLPVGLKDVSHFPNLVAGLRGRGYSDPDIRRILGENLMRVWRAVENRRTQP